MQTGTDYSNTLILVIRGWGDAVHLPFISISGGTLPTAFLELLRSTFPGADVMHPDLDMGTRSKARPRDLVEQLLTEVDRRWAQGNFEELVIVAFSAGTLLARNLYSRACGARLPETEAGTSQALDGPPLPPSVCANDARPWASRIKRMVFLAGVTRGWSISTATPAALRFFAPILLTMLNASARLRGKGQSFIQQIKRGAPFVIESRLLYLQVEQYCAKANATFQLPHTVLLLGSRDEYVSPADALDLGPSKDFTYLEVPGSSHIDVLDVAQGPEPAATDVSDAGRRQRLQLRRAKLIVAALIQSTAQLKTIAMDRDDIDDYIDELDRHVVHGPSPFPTRVDHVVIIVHGIRDNGFWTKRIAREVKPVGRGRLDGSHTLVVRAPSPTYGFFSMWDFINFWGRLDATYWFLDKYAEIRVLYPDVPISFIGHSNGTFLAAHALRLSSMVMLDRVVFAGCVVRTDFDWPCIKGRASSILNFVATSDWVVAFLPGAFQRLGLRFFDVGGAGFDGFGDRPNPGGPAVCNFRYLLGGHGVGVSEPMWRPIADYVVNGVLPDANEHNPIFRRQRTPAQALIGRFSWLAPLVIVALLGLIVWILVATLDGLALAVSAALFVILVNSIVQFF
ncbi:MAG: hypothetical protein KJ558_03535 [Gammaproteobacteria bacterium]|nr:hypothetical protein [Gammaproteobacteria bacterium]MBU1653897.1 hypothetical protein [Gammaproteobacteria bacterium]MBU1960384.1 hypothetical protein [Gammaproteobacteria bacterium]